MHLCPRGYWSYYNVWAQARWHNGLGKMIIGPRDRGSLLYRGTGLKHGTEVNYGQIGLIGIDYRMMLSPVCEIFSEFFWFPWYCKIRGQNLGKKTHQITWGRATEIQIHQKLRIPDLYPPSHLKSMLMAVLMVQIISYLDTIKVSMK